MKKKQNTLRWGIVFIVFVVVVSVFFQFYDVTLAEGDGSIFSYDIALVKKSY